MILPRLHGLWRHGDFMRLWTGETVSVFGSMVGRLALVFTAVIWLDAPAWQVAALAVCEMVPGFMGGFAVGVWVDRLPRRLVMIGADIGRFAVLATVPMAAALGALTIGQLFAVVLARSMLDAFFQSAYQAYLPTLVGREQVLEGNSRLVGSQAVAEFAGFGIAGWLVQGLSAPGAVLVDSFSFLFSAAAIWRIRTPEAAPTDGEERTRFMEEARQGLKTIGGHPVLRALAIQALSWRTASGIFGAVFVLFVTRELDLGPGVQGMIYAIGGVTSLFGAIAAGRSGAWHVGRSLAAATALRAAGSAIPAFAGGSTASKVSVLVVNQAVADPAWTFYEIRDVSLRQAAVPAAMLGRVASTFMAAEFGGALIGTAVGAVLAETLGLRPAVYVAAVLMAAAAAQFWLSAARRVRRTSDLGPAGDVGAAVREAKEGPG